jgi:cytochrome c oxidase subunit 3
MQTPGESSVPIEPEPVAEHYASREDQYRAGKFGMWLFLLTELVMFGGLFCLYFVFRANRPEAFAWGAHFLDKGLGAANTAVLLTSSLTMALAVRAAQLGRTRQLVALLSITFLCGVFFMSVKYVEYRGKWEHALLPGKHFQPADGFVLAKLRGEQGSGAPAFDPAQAARGARVFSGTCAACHGQKGEGLPFLGPGLRQSGFVAVRRSDDLKTFVIVGRSANDPENQMKQLMPPRGGNPDLTDGQIADAVAHLRALQAEQWEYDTYLRKPPGANTFFAIYFLLTGLHGIHVLVGMGLMLWLVALSINGRFHADYFTPVDTVGLYWHLVDIIWIYLFPLLYLIR